jgi:hypothetical protein
MEGVTGSSPVPSTISFDSNPTIRSGPPKGPGFFVFRERRGRSDFEVRAGGQKPRAELCEAEAESFSDVQFPSGGRAKSGVVASRGRTYLNTTEIVFLE